MCPAYRNVAERINDEVTTTTRRTNLLRAITTRCWVQFRVVGSLITTGMLLWVMHNGFKLATDSSACCRHDDWAIHVGILTMLCGFLFLMLGLPIVADLFFNLSETFQEQDGTDTARTTKSISEVIAKIVAAMFTMSMLWWAIFTGFSLAAIPRRHSKYYLLTVWIGVVTIIFGLIYFVIGLAIIAELGLDLLRCLQQPKKRGSSTSRLKP